MVHNNRLRISGGDVYLFMVLYNQLIVPSVLAPDPGNEQREP